MNKKILAAALPLRNKILPVVAAFFVGISSIAATISLEAHRSENLISLESSKPIALALLAAPRPASAPNLIRLSSEQPRFALNQTASSLKELILDGPHPPEPAEPPQPKVLTKLRRATKPQSVPALNKTTTTTTTTKTTATKNATTPSIAAFTPTWSPLGPAPIPNG